MLLMFVFTIFATFILFKLPQKGCEWWDRTHIRWWDYDDNDDNDDNDDDNGDANDDNDDASSYDNNNKFVSNSGLALLCVQCTSEESPDCMVKEIIQICKWTNTNKKHEKYKICPPRITNKNIIPNIDFLDFN